MHIKVKKVHKLNVSAFRAQCSFEFLESLLLGRVGKFKPVLRSESLEIDLWTAGARLAHVEITGLNTALVTFDVPGLSEDTEGYMELRPQ